MTSIDLDVKSVMLQAERNARELAALKDGMNKLLASVTTQNIPEWVTLEQAVSLKGTNLNTTKSNVLLRPGAGNPALQRHCNGRLVFNYHDVVLPWISVTDENLGEYLQNVCHIQVIPDKIKRIIENAKTRTGGQNVG